MRYTPDMRRTLKLAREIVKKNQVVSLSTKEFVEALYRERKGLWTDSFELKRKRKK